METTVVTSNSAVVGYYIISSTSTIKTKNKKQTNKQAKNKNKQTKEPPVVYGEFV